MIIINRELLSIPTIKLLSRFFEGHYFFWFEKSPADKVESYQSIFQNFTVTSEVDNVTTPYVFFISDPFDYQWKEAYFHRMILQAEKQNADLGKVFKIF